MWKLNEGSSGFECMESLEGHENEVKSVTWSNDGEYLASCSRDKTIWIRDTSPDGEYECLTVA